jgi:membrane-associated protease RseP (regulator of RpoE activity)
MKYALLFVALLLQDKKAEQVDLEVLKSKHVAVQVKVNGKGPFRLIFDTGAPVTLVSNRLAKAAELKSSGGFMGMGATATADTFEVGSVKAEKIALTVMDHPTVKILEAACGELDGIVGMNFFGRYNTVIDYQAAKLTFTPSDHRPVDVMQKLQSKLMGGRGKEKQVTPRSVVLGLTLGDEEPSVQAVAPGSAAAEAGLKPGDKITLYDGRWVTTSADVFEIATLVPAGEAVPMKVIREGKEIEVTIKARKGL